MDYSVYICYFAELITRHIIFIYRDVILTHKYEMYSLVRNHCVLDKPNFSIAFSEPYSPIILSTVQGYL